MRLRASSLVLLCSVILVAGCGGGDPAEPSPTSTPSTSTATSTALPSAADLKTFFDAIAGGTPADLDAARELAAPGSPAAAYVGYIAGILAGDAAANIKEPPPSKVVADGDAFKACDKPKDPSTCVIWGDLVGIDGKLADLTVNGTDISGRIVAGTAGPVEADNGFGSVELLYAYSSPASQALVLIVQMTGGDFNQIFDAVYNSLYDPPTGEAVTVESAAAPDNLNGGGSTTFYVVLPAGTPLGGTFHLQLENPTKEVTTTVDLEVPGPS